MLKLKPEFIKLNQQNRIYQCPVPVVGLTGGIASGKSTASHYLEKMGCSIVCADKLVKAIYKDRNVIAEIIKIAPMAVAEEKVDFKLLRKLVFQTPVIKQQVETIIYAKLPEYFHAKVKELQSSFVIYDVPLLFERGLQSLCDLTICVYCSRGLQKSRLIKRDSISPEMAEQMLNAQMPLEQKKEMADFVINSFLTHEELQEQLRSLLNIITIPE